jgi:hypothetical protein
MQENGAIDGARMKAALANVSSVIPYEKLRRDTGYHFVEQVAREAKAVAGIGNLTRAARPPKGAENDISNTIRYSGA